MPLCAVYAWRRARPEARPVMSDEPLAEATAKLATATAALSDAIYLALRRIEDRITLLEARK